MGKLLPELCAVERGEAWWEYTRAKCRKGEKGKLATNTSEEEH